MTNKSGSNISQPDSAQAEENYTRLHISPLDPQLLKVIVPEAVLPKARGISFHTIQTFPDKPFGFVELPTSAAEKIKKKLNGAVLKGNKIRIEPARPAFDMPKPSDDAVADTATGADVERKSKKSKLSKKDRKRKRDPNEIIGVELEEGRKVKRGWTLSPEEAKLKKRKEKEKEKKEKKSSKDKKEKTKKKREPESEYTEDPECLVKTSLPPNKRPVVEGSANDNADGADDDGIEKKKKKSRKHKHQVVVHEFENTSKFPTFFKASATSTSDAPSDFVEGKGWVDDKGEVVQEVKSMRPLTFPKAHVEKKKKKQPIVEDDTTSSSGSSDEEEEDSDDSDDDEQSKVDATSETTPIVAPEHGLNLQTTSASAGSDIQSESASPKPKSASSPKSLTIRIPPATPSSTKVHPLEALYKKQKQEEAEASSKTADAEPFSFFGAGDIEEEEEEDNGAGLAMNEGPEDISPVDRSQGVQMPMTPYSKQDFESRGLRSAAPTPDTAHPSRFSRIWPLGGDRDRPSDVEEEGDDGFGISRLDGSGDEAGEASTNPNTDFQKWFWEHRGDLNRSWKTRRKMAAKEKRYRENRARADKAI
ncbi:hypothetical protein VMCG_10221 [Cytospora schulzeri]|uniref:Uncharacterized protein n=1 Tax=Cytospora schulzeri TaxID=448051 RepID=A0A423VF55_9PEZI|nr:hypothetical protein VMCG_10221 [Valsa malicola]